MGSDFAIPEARPLAPRLNDGTFTSFLHDVHHAYLLLHRAFQSIPPTVIPDLGPMPHPGLEEPDQPDPLRPTSSPVPSPTDEDNENEMFNLATGQDLPHRVAWPKSPHQLDTSLLLRLQMSRSLPPAFRSPHFVPPLQLHLVAAADLQGVTWTGPQTRETFRDLVRLLEGPPPEHGPRVTYRNFATSRRTKRPDRHGNPSLAS